MLAQKMTQARMQKYSNHITRLQYLHVCNLIDSENK